MKNLIKKNIRFIGAWIIINIIFSAVVALIFSKIYNYSFISVLPISLLKVNSISGFSVGFGYYFGRKLKTNSFLKSYSGILEIIILYLGILIISLTGAFVGLFLSIGFLKIALSNDFFNIVYNKLSFAIFATIISASIVSIIAASIDILMYKNRDYQTKLENMNIANKKTYLIIKEKDNRRKIYHDNICYLSSSGKRTIIHTTKEDIEVSLLLKDVTDILPSEKFIRIHKMYVINIDIISSLQHIKSGLYQLHLDDEDETLLPVGRKYVPMTRELLTPSQAL